MSAPRPEILNDAFWDMTGQRLEKLNAQQAHEALNNTPRVQQTLQQRGLTMEQLDKHIANIQKGWFDTYVKGEGGWLSFGTLGNLITAKPVEGVVNTLTFNQLPILGKVARWATVAAAITAGGYYGLELLKQGAITAYGAGDVILDRVGPGGGHLFPGMDMPPAAPYEQALPPADPWLNR